MSQRIVTRNTRWNKLRTHTTKASVWSTLFIGRAGQIQTAHGSLSPTWAMQAMWFMISMQLILLLHAICGVFLPLTSFSYSTMLGHCLLSLHSHYLITWKSIFRRGAVLHTLHLPWYFSFFVSSCLFSSPSC